MKYKLTIYENDGSITYETNNPTEIIKQLESHQENEPPQEEKSKPQHTRPLTPYERTRAAVYATGNRWAIENFNATH
jgi:hypothetical protein